MSEMELNEYRRREAEAIKNREAKEKSRVRYSACLACTMIAAFAGFAGYAIRDEMTSRTSNTYRAEGVNAPRIEALLVTDQKGSLRQVVVEVQDGVNTRAPDFFVRYRNKLYQGAIKDGKPQFEQVR